MKTILGKHIPMVLYMPFIEYGDRAATTDRALPNPLLSVE